MTRYRTIVADPPWHYDGMPSVEANGHDHRVVPGKSVSKPMPYPTLTVEEIEALRVCDCAAEDARLFLWTTNRYLPAAFAVLSAWGFKYRQTLVTARRCGRPRVATSRNSAEFFDLVEQVSPGPYLELFARRARPGWDCWGDEAPDPIEWDAVAA